MGDSNSEIIMGSSYQNSNLGEEEERKLVFSFQNLELGNSRFLSGAQLAESSSSSSFEGMNRISGSLIDDETHQFQLGGLTRVSEVPSIPKFPSLSSSTSPSGGGCDLNSFDQLNQHRNYSGLVSREPILGRARHKYNVHSKLVQEESDYKMIMKDTVSALFNSPDLFIAAALDEKRTWVVQNLIRELKNSAVAQMLTSVLATRCYEIMTHNRGKHVIKQCLLFLGNDPNQVLFEKATENYYELATHKEGCLSLNECINYINGPLRETLLLRIAAASAYLSHDPNGNFVVQHVLSLHNPAVNSEICSCLRGHYVQLSLTQRGSHVVEKCIRWCILGMYYAVEELLMKKKLLCQVAANEFGNYVIQAALFTTKVYASELYLSLVNAIEANVSHMMKNKFGRHVILLVRGEVPNLRRV